MKGLRAALRARFTAGRIAFATGLREMERSDDGRMAIVIGLAVITAGMVAAYSYPGVIWLGVTLLVWICAELLRARIDGAPGAAGALVRRALPIAIPALIIMGVLGLALLPRAIDFARSGAWHTITGTNSKPRYVVSPLEGLVVLKTTWKNGSFGEVQEGEDARPGTPIMDVVDPSAMRIRARINQADIDRVKVGQTVRITLDSYPERSFRGQLQQLSPIASTSAMSSRVRTFLALFSVEGSDPHLLPDLAAAVDLEQ